VLALGGHSFQVNVQRVNEVKMSQLYLNYADCSLYIGIHCCWSVHCMLYVHMVSEMAENYANGPADIDAMGEFLLISFTKFYNGRLLKMSILRPFLYYMKPAYSKAKLMQMAQLCKVPRFRASCISR